MGRLWLITRDFYTIFSCVLHGNPPPSSTLAVFIPNKTDIIGIGTVLFVSWEPQGIGIDPIRSGQTNLASTLPSKGTSQPIVRITARRHLKRWVGPIGCRDVTGLLNPVF
jgi:hypothetical protein